MIKARVVNGDRSTRTLKELQKLSYRYPKNAEIAYILGQFYCEKLWMKDGLGYFRKAIQHDGAFRTNPYLIKAVSAQVAAPPSAFARSLYLRRQM